jgi:MFS family permease
VDRSPLRDHDVRLIVGALGISALGDFLLWIPLTLRIQEMGGSGVAMARLFLALWTPLVVLAPVAGAVVDRRDARGVLLVASLAQMAVAASLVLAIDSIGAMIALAACSAPGSPSRSRQSSRSCRWWRLGGS